MVKILEYIKLNLKFIGFSKRLAAVTIIGLSVSIAMITQNVLFLNSFRNNAFGEFAERQTDTYIQTEMNHVGTAGYNLMPMLEASVTSQIEETNLREEEIAYQEWMTFKFFYLMLYNEKYHENEFHDTYLVGINRNYLELLAPIITNGTAPSLGEFCLITNSESLESTNINTNDTFEAYVPVDETQNPWNSYSMGLGEAGTTLQFSGIINIDAISFKDLTLPPHIQTLISMMLSLGGEIIITDDTESIQTVHYINYARNDIGVMGRIIFDLQEFNVFQLEEHITKLQIFVNRIQEELLGIIQVFSSTAELDINANVIPMLSGFRWQFRIFQILILLFMAPTLIMSLALTAFASSQIKKQRQRHVQNLHQRGASRRMLFVFMLIELIFYAILAVIVGFLIGWPYTYIPLISDGFFSFGRSAAIPIPSMNIVWICVGVGFGLAFLSNIGSVWNRAKTTVEEALHEGTVKKSFWERFYLDVFILIIGIIMWWVASSRISGGSISSLEFAYYFAAPAPILIITGTIMLATRLYPYIIKAVSDLLFKIPNLEMNAISARNAIRRRSSTIQTIVLLTLTFTLTVATIIIPPSYQSYDEEGAYYQLGSDIVVGDVDVLTPTFKSQVDEIEGVESSSYVARLELTNSETDYLYSIELMGVDLENFSKVAYEESEYIPNGDISSKLESIENNTDVIGQINEMNVLDIEDNTSFVIKNWAVEGPNVVQKWYTVNFVDSYRFFPTLFDNAPDPTARELHIGLICNISLPFIIARYDYDVNGQLLVKVKEGYSIGDVADTIEESTQHDTISVEDLLLISEGTLKSTALFGSLNSSFIISLFISGATLLVMMFIQGIERAKEVAILKSMGVNTLQLFNFFISEAILILVFTMIVGLGLGVLVSGMFMRILRVGSVYPPHEMIYPVENIAWTTLAVFGSGLLSSIIPVLINIRKKIGGSLKTI
jgi:ABC-type antimicrobial peptide transport system permease subunit